MKNENTDVWADWLLHRRTADDSQLAERLQKMVEVYADRVIEGARLKPGMTFVDVGAGDGLVAFRALNRLSGDINVILTDISEPLLLHAKSLSATTAAPERCTFLQCSAENLVGIADASVDVVATRSVLPYVKDRPAAIREFYRVLKRGGRISIAEPVMQNEYFVARAMKARIDSGKGQPDDKLLRLIHRCKSAQFPESADPLDISPIVNYNERDLLQCVVDNGFHDAHLELHVDIRPSLITTWETFIGTSPHPWAPTLKEIFAEQFTEGERRFFEENLRPGVETGTNASTDQMAYITGEKPA